MINFNQPIRSNEIWNTKIIKQKEQVRLLFFYNWPRIHRCPRIKRSSSGKKANEDINESIHSVQREKNTPLPCPNPFPRHMTRVPYFTSYNSLSTPPGLETINKQRYSPPFTNGHTVLLQLHWVTKWSGPKSWHRFLAGSCNLQGSEPISVLLG